MEDKERIVYMNFKQHTSIFGRLTLGNKLFRLVHLKCLHKPFHKIFYCYVAHILAGKSTRILSMQRKEGGKKID